MDIISAETKYKTHRTSFTNEARSIYTLSQYPGGNYSTHWGKRQIFKSFPMWDLAINFPLGGQWNPSAMIWKSSELK